MYRSGVTQASTDEALDHAVRLYVFGHAAQTAAVPSVGQVAQALGHSPLAVEESLRRLAAGRVLILAPNSTTIWAATPFCAVPSAFRVQAMGRTYWGLCIWDALGILAALGADGTVTALCGDCGEPMRLQVQDEVLVQREGLVHFGVPASRWWENIGFT